MATEGTACAKALKQSYAWHVNVEAGVAGAVSERENGKKWGPGGDKQEPHTYI